MPYVHARRYFCLVLTLRGVTKESEKKMNWQLHCKAARNISTYWVTDAHPIDAGHDLCTAFRRQHPSNLEQEMV